MFFGFNTQSLRNRKKNTNEENKKNGWDAFRCIMVHEAQNVYYDKLKWLQVEK